MPVHKKDTVEALAKKTLRCADDSGKKDLAIKIAYIFGISLIFYLS